MEHKRKHKGKHGSMKTYKIKSLETGKELGEVNADGFNVNDEGVVTFYTEGGSGKDRFGNRTNIGTTQVSSSTLIAEEKPPTPVLVINRNTEMLNDERL